MNAAAIRNMATTLYDYDIDLTDQEAVITLLLVTGWPRNEVVKYLDAATLMALTRKINERKRKCRRG